MTDSLIVADVIELLGGGPASTIAECAGAVLHLGQGFDLGEAQPTSDYVASLVLDGERPAGQRASNRMISLPVVIGISPAAAATMSNAQVRATIAAAREILVRVTDKQHWLLRWTREGGKTLVFDCYRAGASKPVYSTLAEKQGWIQITITFPAAPYGRSDDAVSTAFTSPLAGIPVPPGPVAIDNFTSVSGAQWALSPAAPAGVGADSAFWDPGIAPANDPAGLARTATYSKTGLALNLSEGWTGIIENTGTASQGTLTQGDAGPVDLGDQFQIAGNAYTGDNTGFEGGTIGGWYNYANAALTNTVAQAHSGTHSMQISSVAAGDAVAAQGGPNVPCLPGDNVYVAAWPRAQASPRTIAAGVLFLDSNSNPIGTPSYTGFLGSTVTDATTGWGTSPATAQIVAPAGAVLAQAVVKVQATGGAAEIHYVDDIVIACRGSIPLQAQIFTVTSISPPSVGFVNIGFSPPAATAPVLGNILIQTGPPSLPAITVWAGFGSSKFFHNWARRGGPVHFLLKLTDTYGNTVSSSKILPRVFGSNSSASPKWVKVRIPLTYQPGFDYANVTGYSITVTNRGAFTSWTQLYLAALTAVPATTQVVVPQRGVVYDLAGMVGSARCAPTFQFQQAGAFVTNTVSFTTPGTFYWAAPFSVNQVTSVLTIGGGGFNPHFYSVGGGGGSGGSSGTAASVAVTPGSAYKIIVGNGGFTALIGPLHIPIVQAPGLSSFTGDSVTVSAPGGNNSTSQAGAPANAAGTPSGFAGGPGGAGTNSSPGGGGAGGGSAGTGSAGNPGGAASGSTGGAAPAAVAGGGPGGPGGTRNLNNGRSPASPPGGAAGGSPDNGFGSIGTGDAGLVSFQYMSPPTFKTLLVHRPGHDTDENFNPLLPIPAGDPVNGTITYILPSLVPGIYPRFGQNGVPMTCTVVAVANTWNNPTASRTISVTVTLYEQLFGSNYPQTVTSQPFIPNNLPLGSPFVILGNLTIPNVEVPPDNLSALFGASVTDSNTSDTLYDILFLDTTGTTVIVSSPNGYTNMYIDEPAGTRAIGMVLGSTGDRTSAVSLLASAQMISGRPLTIDPHGNQSLLAYCVEGAPNMEMTYNPHWMLDRLA
jgi:hypothetical protein